MIGASPSVKVFAYTEPVDMRKGFDGLFGLVKAYLGRDPLSGDLFVFVAKNRKRAKVLLWDGTGLCLYAKRLERGQFANLWSGDDKAEIELTVAELQLFMEGSQLVGKVPVSPRKLCLNCLTKQGFIETIQHVEGHRNPRPKDPPRGCLSP